jgi:hypothetical protein
MRILSAIKFLSVLYVSCRALSRECGPGVVTEPPKWSGIGPHGHPQRPSAAKPPSEAWESQRDADRIAVTYSMISVTTPAPTVRPPSRIANRNSVSMAIGVISSTSICTLSPGITISTPSGNSAAPVTSVVRK